MYDDIARHLCECDAKLKVLLAERGRVEVDLDKAPISGSMVRLEFDVRQALTNWAGVDLTCINGLGVSAVMKLLAEIGPDLSRFASVKHFCSWLSLYPGTKISGGKVLSSGTRRSANRARHALKIAAMSLSHSHSALGAFYHRLYARIDKPRAEHRGRSQTRASGVLHAHPWRGLRRSGPTALRRTAAPALDCGLEASCSRAEFRTQPDHGRRMKNNVFSSVSWRSIVLSRLGHEQHPGPQSLTCAPP